MKTILAKRWTAACLAAAIFYETSLPAQETPPRAPSNPPAEAVRLPGARPSRPRPTAPEAQLTVPTPSGTTESFAVSSVAELASRPALATSDTRFDLDFAGGKPRDLIARIEAATGEPINAIIPDAHESVTLPPLRLREVTVDDLFATLMAASRRMVMVTNSFGVNFPAQVQQSNVEFGFVRRKPEGSPYDSQGDRRPGRPIWYFFYSGPASVVASRPPVSCRYFSLVPFLNSYQVADITRAIETGWSMLPERSAPELKYDANTRLLIAVGTTSELSLIEAVLRELTSSLPGAATAPAPVVPTKTNDVPVRR